MSRGRTSLRARLLLAGLSAAIAGAAAFAVWNARDRRSSTTLLDADAADVIWRGDELYAVDPIAGHRPRRSATARMPMLEIGRAHV